MEQPINQFESPKSSVQSSPIIISVVLTALVVGGGIYGWTSQKQTELNNEIVSLRNQVDQLKGTSGVTPTPTPTPVTQQNLKGWLLIYDPSATVSELHNKGFKPLTWYLAPKDITWPGSPSSDIELIFNNDSVCYKPKDQFLDAIEFNCKDPKIKWGYGDRVRIWGSKSNNVVTVSRMEIASSLPVEQW